MPAGSLFRRTPNIGRLRTPPPGTGRPESDPLIRALNAPRLHKESLKDVKGMSEAVVIDWSSTPARQRTFSVLSSAANLEFEGLKSENVTCDLPPSRPHWSRGAYAERRGLRARTAVRG